MNHTSLRAPDKLPGSDRDWSKIRGFNYQPSYGSSGIELWQRFDAKTVEIELARGKKYFPGMNTLRWWQSWDAYIRDPELYLENFEITLALAAKVGCAVVPVLFNRWHAFDTLDYGGIYTDHFFPPGAPWSKDVFVSYIQKLVGAHKDDSRILAWDLCNEPALRFDHATKHIAESEFGWLKSIHDTCKSLGTTAPLTVGSNPLTPLELIDPISDVLSIHPYWAPNMRKYFAKHGDFFGEPENLLASYDEAAYERKLDADVAFACKVNKPLLATECCWGDLNDEPRVEGIRYTLAQLKKRHISWTAYLLHHSLIADAHRPEFGPVGPPGNLSFIEADGSLRPGHGAFNEF